MKICYKDWNPSKLSLLLVSHASDIITEYEDDGYTLTLRQIYYQFVARGIIENSNRSYKNLGTLITKARLAGLISWEAIEDRNRKHNSPYVQDDELGLIEALPHYIRFDYWENQPYYVEVWVEKEALGNVIERACDPYYVSHMACKGYLSASEAWRAGQRFKEALNKGKKCTLIHLGDHDPSGIDMTRDNQDRLNLFTGMLWGVSVERIALNMDQVEEYNPPPNPAPVKDSRSDKYIEKYGEMSWELDALEPKMMLELIQNKIKTYIDFDVWKETKQEEEEVKERFRRLHRNWDEVKGFLSNWDPE